jgi:DNA (cytosine-5)-methyltransferase 1
MSDPLVLSLFPGIGLLDRAFEEEGFCVVRGPDLLWGGDVKTFHPPAGKFDGVIGGPPCQQFSQVNQAARMGLQALAPNLIPEFERCVDEARPCWFLMENVVQAPLPSVAAIYGVKRVIWNNRWNGGVQNRVRSLVFGCRRRPHREFIIEGEALMASEKAGCFTANGTQWDADKGRLRGDRTFKSFAKGLRLQGLPADFLEDAPFTVEGKVKVIGNGVPLPMGRAIAKAVRQAMGYADGPRCH